MNFIKLAHAELALEAQDGVSLKDLWTLVHQRMLLDNPQSKPLDASLQQHLNQTLLTLPHIEVSNPSDPNCILKMDQNRADQLLLVKRSQPVELLSGALKILRIIAKSRQEGINAIVLSQTSGEPSKEVFRYLKVLLQEQIVFKMPIAYNKGPTSLLIHAHYVRYSSVFQEHMRRSQHVSSITNETTRPLRMNTVEAFLTLLRNAKNKTMSTYDLKHCLQIPQEHSALKSYYSLTSTMQQNKQIELIRVPMVIHEKERLVNCYRLLEDNTEKEVVEKEPIEIRGFDYHQTLEQQLYFCIRETPSLSTSEISTSLNTAERMISVQVDTLTSAKKVNITTTQQQRSKVLRYHVQGHKGEKHSFEKRRAALLKLVQSEKVVPVIRNSCKTLDEILGSETSTDLKTMLRDGDYLHRQRKLRKHVVTYLDSNRKRAVKTLLLQNDLETSHPLVQDCVQQLSLATMRTAKEPLTEEMEVDLMQLPGRRKTTASIAERNAIARSYGYYYCHCYRLRSVHVWLVSLGQTQSLHINYLVDNASLQLILQIFGCLTNNDYLDKLLEVPGSLKLRFLDIQKDHPEVFDSIFTVERRSRNRFKHSLLLLLQRLETMHLISIDNDAVIVPQEITLFDYSKQPMEPLRQIQVTTEEEAIQFWTDLESDCRLKMGALDSDHPFAYLYLSGNWRQQAVLKPEERTKLQSHIKETELGLFTPYRSEYQLEQAARDANVSIEDAKSFYRLIEQEHRKKNGRVLDLARPNKIKTLNKLRFKVKPILQRKMWPEEEDQRVIMAAAILSHVSSKIPWSRLGKTFGGRTHSSVGSRFRKIVKNGNNLAIFNALKSVWPNYGRAYEPVTRETIVDLLDFFQARIERDRVFEKVNEFMPVQAQTEMRIDIKDYLDGNYDFKFERTPTWLQVLGTVSRPIKNAFWNHSSQGVSLDPDFVPETWQVVFGNLYTISKIFLQSEWDPEVSFNTFKYYGELLLLKVLKQLGEDDVIPSVGQTVKLNKKYFHLTDVFRNGLKGQIAPSFFEEARERSQTFDESFDIPMPQDGPLMLCLLDLFFKQQLDISIELTTEPQMTTFENDNVHGAFKVRMHLLDQRPRKHLRLVDDIQEVENNRLEQVYEMIKQTGEQGLNKRDLKCDFDPEPVIQTLLDQDKIVICGFHEPVYVEASCSKPFKAQIHKHPQEILPRMWMTPNGQLSQDRLDEALNCVYSYIFLHAGISFSNLYQFVSKNFTRVELHELVKILIKQQKITQRTVTYDKIDTLFDGLFDERQEKVKTTIFIPN